jgi:hypothetical protein
LIAEGLAEASQIFLRDEINGSTVSPLDIFYFFRILRYPWKKGKRAIRLFCPGRRTRLKVQSNMVFRPNVYRGLNEFHNYNRLNNLIAQISPIHLELYAQSIQLKYIKHIQHTRKILCGVYCKKRANVTVVLTFK